MDFQEVMNPPVYAPSFSRARKLLQKTLPEFVKQLLTGWQIDFTPGFSDVQVLSLYEGQVSKADSNNY